MVAQLVTSAPLTRETLVQWVTDIIEQDAKEPIEASAVVLDEIRRDGLQDALLEILGPAVVCDVWRRQQQDNRPAALPQGARKVDLAKLRQPKSLLEGMYEIDGHWVRLGDMDRAACKTVAISYRRVAITNEHNARYFAALSKALGDGETVCQKFDDGALLALFEKVRPKA